MEQNTPFVTDICSDDSKCNLLMTNFDVCTSQDVALQFCKKTCGLCPNSGSTHCQDTRFDCEYTHNYIDMCTSETVSIKYHIGEYICVKLNFYSHV